MLVRFTFELRLFGVKMSFIDDLLDLFSLLFKRENVQKPGREESKVTEKNLQVNIASHSQLDSFRAGDKTVRTVREPTLKYLDIANSIENRRRASHREYGYNEISMRNLPLDGRNSSQYNLVFNKTKKVSAPLERVIYRPNMVKDLMMYTGNTQFSVDDEINNSFRLLDVNPCTAEYLNVRRSFDITMHLGFKVQAIQKIENPFLFIQFHIKKLQKHEKGIVITESLFHGTWQNNIHPICSKNFNWRLKGTSLGYRFGQGVSFAKRSSYASFYPSAKKNYDNPRVMFRTQVLTVNKCHGTDNMLVPPEGFDTTIHPEGKVIVKYEDNEFYPEYIIYYA